jgi:hypothetical protein
MSQRRQDWKGFAPPADTLSALRAGTATGNKPAPPALASDALYRAAPGTPSQQFIAVDWHRRLPPLSVDEPRPSVSAIGGDVSNIAALSNLLNPGGPTVSAGHSGMVYDRAGYHPSPAPFYGQREYPGAGMR